MSTESRLFAGDDTVTERIVEAQRARRFYLWMIAVLGLLALAGVVLLWSRGRDHPLLIAFVALSCAAGASVALLLARAGHRHGNQPGSQPGAGSLSGSRQSTQPRPRA